MYKTIMSELNEEIEKSIIIIKDFNIPVSISHKNHTNKSDIKD